MTTTTKKPKRSGRITCGQCGKPVVTGTWVKLMFCPDSRCINSEDSYLGTPRV